MPTLSIGVIIAIVVLLLAIVFTAIGQIPALIGALIAGLALARIVP
jgi:Kef-type K+ transport system membrane component KefB